MEPVIIVALITAGGGILAQLIIASVTKKSTTEIINYRIDELENKVDKHNSLIDRMYKMEKCSELQDQRLCEIEREIQELERR